MTGASDGIPRASRPRHLEETNQRSDFPLRAILRVALHAALGTAPEPLVEAEQMIAAVRPAPRVIHAERIPPAEPFITVYNHYDRPGLRAWWGPVLAALTIGRQRRVEPRVPRAIFAGEWSHPLVRPFTRWLFGRLARSYGLITLPPFDQAHRRESAVAVRRLVRLTAGDDPPLVSISPEARSSPDLGLLEPPAGAGLLLLMLSHDRLPFLPVGFYEDADGVFVASFGHPFRLATPAGRDRGERDRAAMRQLMVAVGTLLPERMWGAYADDIRAAGSPPVGS